MSKYSKKVLAFAVSKVGVDLLDNGEKLFVLREAAIRVGPHRDRKRISDQFLTVCDESLVSRDLISSSAPMRMARDSARGQVCAARVFRLFSRTRRS